MKEIITTRIVLQRGLYMLMCCFFLVSFLSPLHPDITEGSIECSRHFIVSVVCLCFDADLLYCTLSLVSPGCCHDERCITSFFYTNIINVCFGSIRCVLILFLPFLLDAVMFLSLCPVSLISQR